MDVDELDVDALVRAAREQRQQKPALRWRGRRWELPDDVPLVVAETMGDGRVLDGLAALLGDDVRLLDPPVGIAEADIVARQIARAMGVTPGESAGS